ncbi:Ger(x)C family spore germination protein [Kroppenstedtia pulmonis]|uniref:Ger(X)C family spore germination protein n=1 Tax=Kroppenstedtia pulmonis TaxID=1380685 RepID=A0A7D3XMI1_9BACL|nr:Ger(x)C family spore germination protein [Kroppenstedtia pulmonis]QKG84329.1 Ger(x)C family spore germination protein [Kroppenstedtia pulmonis]
MRLRKVGVILLIGTMTLLPSGCWDLQNLSTTEFATAVGIDYLDGQYHVYVQFSNFSNLMSSSEGGGGGSGSKQLWVAKGVGSTVDAAFNDLFAISQNIVRWGHLGAVVLHENVLKEGIEASVDTMNRYFEVRHTVWLYATDQPILPILATPPVVYPQPLDPQLVEPLDTYKQRSLIQPLPMYEVLRLMNEPGHSLLLPMVKLVKDRWSTNESTESIAIVSGVCTVHNYRISNKFPDISLEGLPWMNQNANRIRIVLKKKGEAFATMEGKNPKVKVVPHVTKNEVFFDVKVKTAAQLVDLRIFEQKKNLINMVEKEIERQIRHTFLEGVKKREDLYSLSHVLYRKDPDRWAKLSGKRKWVPLTPSSLRNVQVDVTIKDTGRAKLKKWRRDSE